MKKFEPEYHLGMGEGRYYAVPMKRSGTSKLMEPRLHQRCWAVCRELLCINEVFDTYEEANDRASELATQEILKEAKALKEGWKPSPVYGHLPGIIEGYLENDEEVA